MLHLVFIPTINQTNDYSKCPCSLINTVHCPCSEMLLVKVITSRRDEVNMWCADQVQNMLDDQLRCPRSFSRVGHFHGQCYRTPCGAVPCVIIWIFVSICFSLFLYSTP